MTTQKGNSIALGTRVKRQVYDELKEHINSQNATVSSVASLAIELGLRVLKKLDGNVQDVVNELEGRKAE